MNRISAHIIKKLAALFSLLTVLVLPSVADAATLSLSPATATVNKNCTFEIKINLDTQGEQTDGTDVLLSYDATKFSVTTSSIVNGNIYSDYPGNSITNGVISISGIAPAASPYSGSGTFATLNVQVLSAAAGTGTFAFKFNPQNKTDTTDTNVVQGGADPVDILSQVTDGTYTIGTGTTCTGATAGGSGGTTGGANGGSGSNLRRLPAGGQGAPIDPGYAGGPATDSAKQMPIGQLPDSGLEGPTLMFAIVGGVLTVVGLLGLAFL